jgi:hypothetical protein
LKFTVPKYVCFYIKTKVLLPGVTLEEVLLPGVTLEEFGYVV